jgi:hypothetical protein
MASVRSRSEFGRPILNVVNLHRPGITIERAIWLQPLRGHSRDRLPLRDGGQRFAAQCMRAGNVTAVCALRPPRPSPVLQSMPSPNVSRSPSPTANVVLDDRTGESGRSSPTSQTQQSTTGLQGRQPSTAARNVFPVRQDNPLKGARAPSPTSESGQRPSPEVNVRQLREAAPSEATADAQEIDAYDIVRSSTRMIRRFGRDITGPDVQRALAEIKDNCERIADSEDSDLTSDVAGALLDWMDRSPQLASQHIKPLFDILTHASVYDGLNRTPAALLNNLPALVQAGLLERGLAFVESAVNGMNGYEAGHFANEVLKQAGHLTATLTHAQGREAQAFAPVNLAVERGMDAFTESLNLDPLFNEAPHLLSRFPSLTQSVLDTLYHGLSNLKPGEDNTAYSSIPEHYLKTWAAPLAQIAASPGQVTFEQFESLRQSVEAAANVRQTHDAVRLNVSFDGGQAKLEIVRKPRGTEIPEPPKQWHQELGIWPTAPAADIKSAYKALALKHHPDKVPPEQREQATEKFKLIGKALEDARAMRPNEGL